MSWVAFCELVNRVLIPLAEIRILHTGIRPGYDVTHNAFYKIGRDFISLTWRVFAK